MFAYKLILPFSALFHHVLAHPCICMNIIGCLTHSLLILDFSVTDADHTLLLTFWWGWWTLALYENILYWEINFQVLCFKIFSHSNNLPSHVNSFNCFLSMAISLNWTHLVITICVQPGWLSAVGFELSQTVGCTRLVVSRSICCSTISKSPSHPPNITFGHLAKHEKVLDSMRMRLDFAEREWAKEDERPWDSNSSQSLLED